MVLPMMTTAALVIYSSSGGDALLVPQLHGVRDALKFELNIEATLRKSSTNQQLIQLNTDPNGFTVQGIVQ